LTHEHKRAFFHVRNGAEIVTEQRSITALVVSLIGGTLLLACLVTFPHLSHAYTDADAVQGKQLFEKRCTGCHSLDQNKEGPRLRGVYGRSVGKVSGFDYSVALRSSQLIWDDASLERWLSNPDSFIADNDMAFHVSKPDERAAIIRYLKTLSVN